MDVVLSKWWSCGNVWSFSAGPVVVVVERSCPVGIQWWCCGVPSPRLYPGRIVWCLPQHREGCNSMSHFVRPWQPISRHGPSWELLLPQRDLAWLSHREDKECWYTHFRIHSLVTLCIVTQDTINSKTKLWGVLPPLTSLFLLYHTTSSLNPDKACCNLSKETREFSVERSIMLMVDSEVCFYFFFHIPV